MQIEDPFDLPETPLRKLARDIARRLHDEAVADHFRLMIEAAASEHAACDLADVPAFESESDLPPDMPEDIKSRALAPSPQNNPVQLIYEDRSLSISEEYAVVAAVHDELMTAEPPVHSLPACCIDFSDEDYYFAHLRRLVRELVEQGPQGDQECVPKLKDMFEHVDRDLQQRGLLPAGDAAAGHPIALAGEQTAAADEAAGVPAEKPKNGRKKREVIEPKIADHLQRRPHDTIREVAEAVGCSTGFVSGSRSWKMNQSRLAVSKREGIDPIAVKLDERVVNAASGEKEGGE